jgi:hypothetical protein
MWGWLMRTHTEHLLTEIQWLRDELRFERDRNARLQDLFLSFKTDRAVYTMAPPVSRAEDDGAKKLAEAAKSIDELNIGELPG